MRVFANVIGVLVLNIFTPSEKASNAILAIENFDNQLQSAPWGGEIEEARSKLYFSNVGGSVLFVTLSGV